MRAGFVEWLARDGARHAFADICAALVSRREHFASRIAVAACDVDGALAALRARADTASSVYRAGRVALDDDGNLVDASGPHDEQADHDGSGEHGEHGERARAGADDLSRARRRASRYVRGASPDAWGPPTARRRTSRCQTIRSSAPCAGPVPARRARSPGRRAGRLSMKRSMRPSMKPERRTATCSSSSPDGTLRRRRTRGLRRRGRRMPPSSSASLRTPRNARQSSARLRGSRRRPPACSSSRMRRWASRRARSTRLCARSTASRIGPARMCRAWILPARPRPSRSGIARISRAMRARRSTFALTTAC
uniref:hypothetical protein n=1 Tax=Burkholderia thailandensis TaxID=57975 RepID=UPI003855BA79